MSARKAVLREADEIFAGQTYAFDERVDADKVQKFADVIGDFNPLHCDTGHALSCGYAGPVAHGAYQIGLASQMVGMWLIGVRCLVSKVVARFHVPLVCPETVRVVGTVVRWSASHRAGLVRVQISNASSGIRYSDCDVEVSFHKERMTSSVLEVDCVSEAGASLERKTVLVTGATSGLMREIIPDLIAHYDIVAVGNDGARLREFERILVGDAKGWLRTRQMDLTAEMETVDHGLREAIEGRKLWGVVHAAALPGLSCRLLEWTEGSMERSLRMNVSSVLALARCLHHSSGGTGGRMILIGSNYSMEHHPQTKLLAYGWVKSALVDLGRGLADELASEKITVNSVSPEFMAVGMNAAQGDRFLRLKAAENPMRRLCQPRDVAAAIRFFLSDEAEFITGQDVVISGGMK